MVGTIADLKTFRFLGDLSPILRKVRKGKENRELEGTILLEKCEKFCTGGGTPGNALFG